MPVTSKIDIIVERRARARVGTWLNEKYRLDRVLGIGGMAVVYAATHRNQAEFAVKMLHPELSINTHIRERFLREGYVANTVKHSGAVRVVDDDIAEDGSAFLVMDLLQGVLVEDLWTRFGERLAARAAISIAHDLLDTLEAAHAKSIVHRDIKPANVFVTTEGVVKVLDFGIARMRDVALTGSGATQTGLMMGTPAFMAPEQANARANEIDAQTDVWGVGATLFTLLSGQLVHEGDNAQQLVIRAATVKARSLASVAPLEAQAVVSVVDRALAYEKAERWASAAEMRDALREACLATFGEGPSQKVLAALVSAEPMAPPSSRRPPHAPILTDPQTAMEIASTLAAPSNPPLVPAAASSSPPSRSTEITSTHSTEQSPAAASARRRNTVALVAAGALALCIGGLAIARITHRAEAAPSSDTALPIPTIAASIPPLPPDEGSAGLAASSSPVPTPSSTASSPPATAQTNKPSARSRVAAPVRSTSPAIRPDCEVPYTLDPSGNKKWKVQCLAP